MFTQFTILTICCLFPLVKGNCLNQVFFLENSAYQPQKGEYRIRNPGYYWKQNIIDYGYGQEIFDKLDETKYEYMFHAYHSSFGLEVYRICEKNSEFTRYGKAEHHLGRGYLLQIPDIMSLDGYLYRNRFTIKRTPVYKIKKYLEDKKKAKQEKYEREHPYMSKLTHAVNEVLNLIMYMLLFSPFILVITWSFYN